MCLLPLVRFQISQLSTVPKASLPAPPFRAHPSTLSRIHAILVRKNKGRSTGRSSGGLFLPCRRVHLVASCGGAPILPDDGVVHGLAGLAIPDDRGFALVGDAHAARSRGRTPALPRTSTTELICEVRMSKGSCSTHPLCG